MRRRAALLSTVLMVVFVLVLTCGCALFQKDTTPDPGEIGNNSGEPGGDENSDENSSDPNNEAPPDETTPDGEGGKKEEERKVKITLFFGDKKAIEKDSPCETGYVTPVVREFPHTTAVLRLALQELFRGPLPGEGDLVRTVPEKTRLLDVKVENEVALIDFSSELITETPGGTLGGSVLIQSLVYTATQFARVKRVLVRVEGETYSDGHFIWEYPIGREDFNLSG